MANDLGFSVPPNNQSPVETNNLNFYAKAIVGKNINVTSVSATTISATTHYLSGLVYDSTGLSGATNQVLTETATGIQWQTPKANASANLYLFYNY